jgi:hypothetical protein
MHSEIKHLAKLFKEVEAIREVIAHDCHMADMEATSIDDVVKGFSAYFGRDYEFYLVPDLSGDLLRGLVLRFEKLVEVYLDREMPEQWIKYIQVKEMCCTILTETGYETTDPGVLLELMIYEETDPVDGDAPADLVSDMWAKLAAHELLFPYSLRAEVKQQIGSGDESIFSISERFGLPEPVIEQCLRSGYHELCEKAWTMAADLPHAAAA